jgi:hypothetical protein
MTTPAVSARRFALITAQLLRALIMAGVTVVLCYLLLHAHARHTAPHTPASQSPTVEVIAPRPGAASDSPR